MFLDKVWVNNYEIAGLQKNTLLAVNVIREYSV